MTWTPDDLARLKALRDKAAEYPGHFNLNMYYKAILDSDPISRIEELEREVARLSKLTARMTPAALADDCHHCDERRDDDGPCWWCGRTKEAQK